MGRARSAVWDHFEVVPKSSAEGQIKQKCKFCKGQFSPYLNTLRKHFAYYCKEVDQDIRDDLRAFLIAKAPELSQRKGGHGIATEHHKKGWQQVVHWNHQRLRLILNQLGH